MYKTSKFDLKKTLLFWIGVYHILFNKKMLQRIIRSFSTTTNKTYGNLKDADRIFTNVYKDTDPYINGALRRVLIFLFREIGIVLKTSLLTAQNG